MKKTALMAMILGLGISSVALAATDCYLNTSDGKVIQLSSKDKFGVVTLYSGSDKAIEANAIVKSDGSIEEMSLKDTETGVKVMSDSTEAKQSILTLVKSKNDFVTLACTPH